MRHVEAVGDRSTLEQIIEEADAPADVRRFAAERLFAEAHVRSHARRGVREAAAKVIEDHSLLRAIADHDSEPTVRAIALGRLGDTLAIQTCGLCGQPSLSSETVCRCGFDLANGDLAAAQDAIKRAKLQGTPTIVSGIIVIGLGFIGGMSLLPIRFSLFLRFGEHSIDLVFVGVGCTLIGRGRRMRAGTVITS